MPRTFGPFLLKSTVASVIVINEIDKDDNVDIPQEQCEENVVAIGKYKHLTPPIEKNWLWYFKTDDEYTIEKEGGKEFRNWESERMRNELREQIKPSKRRV